jgi:hypothetical protein
MVSSGYHKHEQLFVGRSTLKTVKSKIAILFVLRRFFFELDDDKGSPSRSLLV